MRNPCAVWRGSERERRRLLLKRFGLPRVAVDFVSYLDEGSGGPENEFAQRNTTFMTWNLLHLARMLRSANGIPAHGNQRSAWEAGCRFDHQNPEHR